MLLLVITVPLGALYTAVLVARSLPFTWAFVVVLPPVAAAAAGQVATQAGTRAWYAHLRKPSWTPPSWVFGPVWTGLYAQMAYSAKRVGPTRRTPERLWWLQLGLNAAWSPVLFGARKPRAGAVVACALVPAVAATAAWSAFAAALSVQLARLNR